MTDEFSSTFLPAKCTEIGDMFPSYLSSNLPADQCEKIEEHLAVCPQCRDELRFHLAMREIRSKQRTVG
jgi:anti-sigma factor RsiW